MSEEVIPTEFVTVINNFISNISNTFPEYLSIIHKWCGDMNKLWVFCKKKYPPKRAYILSKNVYMFDELSEVDTEFLPHIHFKNIWQYEGISESTKDAIWGYLKLTLLSVDTDQIDLDEVFNQVQELFKYSSEQSEHEVVNTDPEDDSLHADTPLEMPTPLDGMFGGVLGDIAKDLAEDMMSNPDFSMDGISSVEDAMKNIFSNPSRMTQLFKTVSEKLDNKLTSGEVSNSDIMRETTNLMSKLKDMPGIPEGMSGLFGKSGDTPSDSGVRNRPTTTKEQIKERLRKKVKK